MPDLTLPQNPKECWPVQAREQWDKKFGALWNIVVIVLLLSPSHGIIITVIVFTLAFQQPVRENQY